MGFIRYLTENITLYKILKEIGSFILIGVLVTLGIITPLFLLVVTLSFLLWSGSYFAVDLNYQYLPNLPNVLSVQDAIALSLGVISTLFSICFVSIILWIIIINPIKKKYEEYKREIEYEKLHKKE